MKNSITKSSVILRDGSHEIGGGEVCNTKQRDVSIDIIKALGIICMVAGHCRAPFTHFIYLFHMAVFFIASGYCFKETNSLSFASTRNFVKRKILTLWLPYALWTTIYSLLHNFFIRVNIYTDSSLLLEYVSGAYIKTTEYWSTSDVVKNIIKAMLLHGGTQMGGALWFLATLLEISIGYCIVNFALNCVFKNKKSIVFFAQSVISCLFLGLGFICYKTSNSFFGMDKVLSFYILFHGGFTVKKYGWSNVERKRSVHIVILALTFSLLLICNNMGSIELNENSYVNPLYFLVVSFAGWQFFYEIAIFLQQFSFIKYLFVCIGQNTLAVVILHFLCFKIVNYCGVLLNHQPLCLVAAFPILYNGGVWWVAYSIAGLAIPVMLSILWKNLDQGLFSDNIKHNQ